MITNRLELFKKKDNVMYLKGGVVMGKLLFVIALCLSFTALAGAYDVINIDLNGSASDPCYTGLGPFGNPSYVDVNDWNGFYQGVGVMMASPRNSGIGTPGSSATYARALFIADPCSHNYMPYTTGNELLNDGFQKTPPPTDPNPGLFFWGSMAYGGVYDVYVIADVAGAFTIKDSNGDTQSASLSGGGGAWAEGTNYVKFEDVEIATPASRDANGPIQAYVSGGYLADPNCVVLTYSNQIDGIQFASVKRRVMNTRGVPPNDANFSGGWDGIWTAETPITLRPVSGTLPNRKTNVFAADYDVSFDTNLRSGEFTYDGPDCDWASGKVHYIDKGDQWEYDLIVDSTTDGTYILRILTNFYWGDADYSVYIDDSLELGRMLLELNDGVDANIPRWSNDSTVTATPSGDIYLNLFQGFRTLKIKSNTLYFDFQGFQLWHSANLPNMDTCAKVIAYGYGLDGDVNSDCYVNFKDLQGIVDDWASCNDPCECEIEEVW